MVTSSEHLFPYDSITKYNESLVQCPICHYYIKINPQTDSMKYKLIAKDVIQFLTLHQFNSSFHTIIIEYRNFSFFKIITFSDSSKEVDIDSSFPLYHVVDLSEYTTFRNRVLSLESNNNDLITSFKSKLDVLELSYKQTELDNTSLRQQVLELNDLRENFEHVLSDTMVLLDSTKIIVSNQSEEKRDLQKQVNILEREKFSSSEQIKLLEKKISDLTSQLNHNKDPNSTPITIVTDNSDSKLDPKLLELLDIERHQKRDAIREKKEIEQKVIDLETKITELSNNSSNESTIEQLKHDFTLQFENQISNLTLALQDRDDQIQLLKQSTKSYTPVKNEKIGKKGSKSSHFDRNYRLKIAELFIDIQKKFNSLQYDLFLSLYQVNTFNSQLRNAFEQFFSLLIQRANELGQILLSDPEFSLFKDLREINPRLKFSEEQQNASIQLQSLHFILTDSFKYIFAVIKAIRAYYEEDNYVIIPDDIQIHTLISSTFHNSKISFTIPFTKQTKFSTIGQSIRVFRPVSELYKDSFILISKEDDLTLTNNTYKLIPFTFETTESSAIIEIDNFFSEESSFQLGSFFDSQFFVIQKIDFQSSLDSLKSFIEKNKSDFN